MSHGGVSPTCSEMQRKRWEAQLCTQYRISSVIYFSFSFLCCSICIHFVVCFSFLRISSDFLVVRFCLFIFFFLSVYCLSHCILHLFFCCFYESYPFFTAFFKYLSLLYFFQTLCFLPASYTDIIPPLISLICSVYSLRTCLQSASLLCLRTLYHVCKF